MFKYHYLSVAEGVHLRFYPAVNLDFGSGGLRALGPSFSSDLHKLLVSGVYMFLAGLKKNSEI